MQINHRSYFSTDLTRVATNTNQRMQVDHNSKLSFMLSSRILHKFAFRIK